MAIGFEAGLDIFGPGTTGSMEYGYALYIRAAEGAATLEITATDAVTISESHSQTVSELSASFIQFVSVSESHSVAFSRNIQVDDTAILTDIPAETIGDLKGSVSELIVHTESRALTAGDHYIWRTQSVTTHESVSKIVHDFVCVYCTEWINVVVNAADWGLLTAHDNATLSEYLKAIVSEIECHVSDYISLFEDVGFFSAEFAAVNVSDVFSSSEYVEAYIYPAPECFIETSDATALIEEAIAAVEGLVQNVWVKFDGAWETNLSIWLKQEGDWKAATGYVKSEGAWQ